MSISTQTRPDWLLPPVADLAEFPIVQIAQQLSRICRYAGATPFFYSVARHSLLVAELVPDDPTLKLLALVHDAHECWTGDMCRPAKAIVGDVLDDLTQAYDERLCALIGIDCGSVERYLVQAADDEACRLELKFLGKSWIEIRPTLPTRQAELLVESIVTLDEDERLWSGAVSEQRARIV